jgi:hypothetical protein
MGKRIRGKLLIAAVLFAISFAMPVKSQAQEIRAIARGDDLGMTQGSLAGVEKAMSHGLLTATSMIASAPWFEGAAEWDALTSLEK